MLVRTGEKNKLALVINNVLLQTILSSSQKLIYIAIHGHCTTVSGPAKAVVSPTWWSDALQHQSSVSVATNSCPFTERISDFLSRQWGGWCDPTDLENVETTALAKWKTGHCGLDWIPHKSSKETSEDYWSEIFTGRITCTGDPVAMSQLLMFMSSVEWRFHRFHKIFRNLPVFSVQLRYD